MTKRRYRTIDKRIRKRINTKKRSSKKRRKGLCKNIGSTELEVNILKQRIQQIRQKNLQLTKKKK